MIHPVVEMADGKLVVGQVTLTELHLGFRIGCVFALGKIFDHITKLLQGLLRHGLIPVDGKHLLEMAHSNLIDGVGNLRMHGMEFFKLFVQHDGLGIIFIEVKGIRQAQFGQGGVSAQGEVLLELPKSLGRSFILLFFEKTHPLFIGGLRTCGRFFFRKPSAATEPHEQKDRRQNRQQKLYFRFSVHPTPTFHDSPCALKKTLIQSIFPIQRCQWGEISKPDSNRNLGKNRWGRTPHSPDRSDLIFGWYVRLYPIDDIFGGSSGGENLPDSPLLQPVDIVPGDNSSTEDEDVARLLLFQ